MFSDELNHASIIDGIRLASRGGSKGGEQHIYRHNDVSHLQELLNKSRCARKIVVTDSLFSMDGDVAPLKELAQLRREHGFLLVVDEAHATLVFGHRVHPPIPAIHAAATCWPGVRRDVRRGAAR